MIKEYHNVKSVEGPLLFVEGVSGIGYGEIVEIESEAVSKRGGRFLRFLRILHACRFLSRPWGLIRAGRK